MPKQDYQHHTRYYAPHHFIFLPLMAFFVGWGIYQATHETGERLVWILFSVVCFCILYLAIMVRQHYALGNQDRIVRLEFRLRYFEVFGKSCRAAEDRLSFSQIAALRFAEDDEFKGLLEQALEKDLSANEIKKAIHHWKADLMRL